MNRTGYIPNYNSQSPERGEVARSQWLDIGIDANLSEIQATFLYPQLEPVEKVISRRLHIWDS